MLLLQESFCVSAANSSASLVNLASKKKKPAEPLQVVRANKNLATKMRWKRQVIRQVVSAVNRGYYTTAFGHILTAGPAARRAFDIIVFQRVCQQTKSFIRRPKEDGTRFLEFNESSSVSEFSWLSVLSDICSHLPTLTAALNECFHIESGTANEAVDG